MNLCKNLYKSTHKSRRQFHVKYPHFKKKTGVILPEMIFSNLFWVWPQKDNWPPPKAVMYNINPLVITSIKCIHDFSFIKISWSVDLTWPLTWPASSPYHRVLVLDKCPWYLSWDTMFSSITFHKLDSIGFSLTETIPLLVPPPPSPGLQKRENFHIWENLSIYQFAVESQCHA